MRKIILSLSVFVLIFLIFACSPSLSITMKDESTTDFNFNITNTESFFANFSAFMDFNEEDFYNTVSLQSSLESLGFTNIFIQTDKNTDIKIKAQIQNQNFIDEENPLSTLISITNNDFSITIKPENIIEILSSIPEITDYLDLLMAPIYTGEQISEPEYLELFASVYGDSFAQDFEKTNFNISVQTLLTIKDIEISNSHLFGVNFENKTANIQIPLYKLLCHNENNFIKITF